MHPPLLHMHKRKLSQRKGQGQGHTQMERDVA
jgi:hypothetical protein